MGQSCQAPEEGLEDVFLNVPWDPGPCFLRATQQRVMDSRKEPRPLGPQSGPRATPHLC